MATQPYVYIPSRNMDSAVLVGPFDDDTARTAWIKKNTKLLEGLNPNWHTINLPAPSLPVVSPSTSIPSTY